MAKGEDYFSALGAPRRFAQDKAALEKRFYEVSRALHPDRFTGAAVQAKMSSVERMSFLNQAYRTLTNREHCRAYLLQLEGVQTSDPKSKPQLPMELAESWFELQDLVMEDPAQAKSQLECFETELRALQQAEEDVLLALEREYDVQPRTELLHQISQRIQAQSYLKSLDRDVGRIRDRIAGK